MPTTTTHAFDEKVHALRSGDGPVLARLEGLARLTPGEGLPVPATAADNGLVWADILITRGDAHLQLEVAAIEVAVATSGGRLARRDVSAVYQAWDRGEVHTLTSGPTPLVGVPGHLLDGLWQEAVQRWCVMHLGVGEVSWSRASWLRS